MSGRERLGAFTVPAGVAAGAAPAQRARREHPLMAIQRTAGNSATVRLLRAAEAQGGSVPGEVEARIERSRGAGRALDPVVRSRMEAGFGADFSGVRVHTGGEAAALSGALGARAFTTGRDVFFGAGQFDPGSSGGRELIAHELTHVIQQSDAPALDAKLEVGSTSDPAEREADEVARTVIRREGSIRDEDEERET